VVLPADVVTVIVPLLAVLGTVRVIWVGELTVKLAGTPLIVTLVAPVKFVPVTVTRVVGGPTVGKKLVIVGGVAGTVTVKELPVAVPPGVTTLKAPVVAPAGTVALIWVAELTAKFAFRPLNRTAVDPVKLVPVIVTEVPTGPLVGVKLVIVGRATGTVTVKELPVAVPPGVTTLNAPVVALAGTVAVI